MIYTKHSSGLHYQVGTHPPHIDLTKTERSILSIISFYNENAPCPLTNRKLGRLVDRHHATVSRCLRSLEKKQWIERKTGDPVWENGGFIRKRHIYCRSSLSDEDGALQLATLVLKLGGQTSIGTYALLDILGGIHPQLVAWSRMASERGWLETRWEGKSRVTRVVGDFPLADLSRRSTLKIVSSGDMGLLDKLVNFVKQAGGILKGWTNKALAAKVICHPSYITDLLAEGMARHVLHIQGKGKSRLISTDALITNAGEPDDSFKSKLRALIRAEGSFVMTNGRLAARVGCSEPRARQLLGQLIAEGDAYTEGAGKARRISALPFEIKLSPAESAPDSYLDALDMCLLHALVRRIGPTGDGEMMGAQQASRREVEKIRMDEKLKAIASVRKAGVKSELGVALAATKEILTRQYPALFTEDFFA